MCRNYNDLEFTHFVVDNSDGTVFGTARVNGSGRIAVFLIIEQGVKQQAGENWLDLEPELAAVIRERTQSAYGRVPTYRTKRLLLS